MPNVQRKLVGFMGRTMLPRAYQELLGMTEIVTSSGVTGTIARFSAPKDGPKKGVRRSGFSGTDKIGMAVTRPDIATFTAAQLSDERFRNAAPAISN